MCKVRLEVEEDRGMWCGWGINTELASAGETDTQEQVMPVRGGKSARRRGCEGGSGAWSKAEEEVKGRWSGSYEARGSVRGELRRWSPERQVEGKAWKDGHEEALPRTAARINSYI